MPHLDTNDNQSYDFVATNGSEDGPYTQDGEAVTDDAFVQVEAVEQPPDETETETETETEEPLNETETETETETEEPLNETETEEPLNETETETETEAPINETETEADAGVPVDDTENETETETETESEVAAPENASVAFENQTSNGTTVTIDNVTVPEGGYVAIHDQFLFEGDVIGSVVGTSEYLEAGSHENVTVTLFNVSGAEYAQDSLAANETLIAMPHQETNDNETYDFVATNGTEDGAYTVDGEPVTDEALITVQTDAEPVDETETETPVTETEDVNETDDADAGVGLNETTESDDSMNVTDNETTPVNETETGLNETDGLNETETEMPVTETENETDNETAAMDANASVEVTNVKPQGTEVTVNATLSEGGYVAVHDDSLLANATTLDLNEGGQQHHRCFGVPRTRRARERDDHAVRRARCRVRRDRTHREPVPGRDAPPGDERQRDVRLRRDERHRGRSVHHRR